MLTALRPELPAGEARVLAHAAFGLMNSTPFLGGEVDRRRRAELLRGARPWPRCSALSPDVVRTVPVTDSPDIVPAIQDAGRTT